MTVNSHCLWLYGGLFTDSSTSSVITTSIVEVFATFLLLAYCKILDVAFDLLIPIRVYQLDSSQHLSCTWRLYFDATIPYFGAKHLPYALLAIVMLILFGILALSLSIFLVSQIAQLVSSSLVCFAHLCRLIPRLL
jgi:hypothetical protein